MAKKSFEVTKLNDLPVWKIAYIGKRPVVRIDIIMITLEHLHLPAETTQEQVHDFLEWNDFFPPADEVREGIYEQLPELRDMEIFSTPRPELQREDICFFAISRSRPPVAIPEIAGLTT